MLDDFPDDPVEERDDDPFGVLLARVVDLDEDERVCLDAERFLDGPQVDMTLHTVPTGCHTGPRPSVPRTTRQTGSTARTAPSRATVISSTPPSGDRAVTT